MDGYSVWLSSIGFVYKMLIVARGKFCVFDALPTSLSILESKVTEWVIYTLFRQHFTPRSPLNVPMVPLNHYIFKMSVRHQVGQPMVQVTINKSKFLVLSTHFHNMFLWISSWILSHWITTSPHYVEIGTPRAMGSLWRLSCN